MARHAPTDHRCFDHAAGFVIVPSAFEVVAGERQLIRPTMIFAQHLDRQARRRYASAIKFSQSSFACCHLIFP